MESIKSDRSYLETNLKTLKAVFGAAAVKKTIILLTKAEAVLDDNPMH